MSNFQLVRVSVVFWLPCKVEVLVMYQQHYLNCRHLPKKVEYSTSAVLILLV